MRRLAQYRSPKAPVGARRAKITRTERGDHEINEGKTP